MTLKTNPGVQVDLPSPVFSHWFQWSFIDNGAPKAQEQINTDLREVGCYLLARFDGLPPEGAADPADSHVFYIGETHGRTTTLRRRLQQFGNSAGFYGGQWNGSYAAWAYPRYFEKDNEGPGKDGAGKSCSSRNVFVALCPWSGTFPDAIRGVFAMLMEQQALWFYTIRNGNLPILNNNARMVGRTPRPMPPFEDVDLADALEYQNAPKRAEAAVRRIAQHLALKMGYAVEPEPTIETEGNWRGSVRALEKKTYLYIGWLQDEPPAVYLTVYRGYHCLYGEDVAAASTVEQLKGNLQAFWDYWAEE